MLQSILCGWLLPLLCCLACGLIGYWIARYLWRGKYNTLQGDFGNLSGNFDHLQTEYQTSKNSYADLSKAHSDLEKNNASLNLGLQDWQSKYKDLEAQMGAKLGSSSGNVEWESRYNALLVDFDKLKAQSAKGTGDASKWELKFNELNKKFNNLKSENEAKVEEWSTKYANLEGEFGTYKLGINNGVKNAEADSSEWKAQVKELKKGLQMKEKDIALLKSQNADLAEKVNNVGLTYQARLDDWELKYNNLEFRYKDLNGKLKDAESERDAYASKAAAASAAPSEADLAFEAELMKDPELAKIKAKAAAFDFGRIGYATASEKDDLKLVKGIGAYTEKKLNALGIFTFQQLANLSDEDIPKVNDAIEFFKGRVKRDDWRGQAKKFLKSGVKKVVGMGFKKDDLKIVEGIGPKIEGLLHAEGIKTWKALSTTAVEKLQSILDAAGNRYRIHNPGTWAKQAELADQENWEELQKWQDELNGGKKK